MRSTEGQLLMELLTRIMDTSDILKCLKLITLLQDFYALIAKIKEALYEQLIRECSRRKLTQSSNEIAFA